MGETTCGQSWSSFLEHSVVIRAMPVVHKAICHLLCLLFLLVDAEAKVIMATPCDMQ